MDTIWNLFPERYCKIESESRKIILYPKLLDLANNTPGLRVLDYGCGDASVVKFLRKDFEISLFDTSEKVLKIAQKNLEGRKFLTYQQESDLPNNYYDCVILSLVLMTIDNINEIKAILSNIFRVKTKKGKLIVAITHPCFRQYYFSTFHTEYSEGKGFDYFKEGDKFKVFLKDQETNEEINFNDYHWSLANTINLLIESGFNITELIEIADERKESNNFPPYLILTCA